MKAQTLNIERLPAFVRNGKESGTGDAGVIYLMAGGLLRLDVRRHGGNITCFQGECWVTQEGNYADYQLRPGDTFPLARRGRMLVQAMGRAARIGVE